MIGALIVGLVAGFVGKALVPGKDPGGFFVTIILGLAGSALGYGLFRLIGIGDSDAFDLGGLLGAIIGVIILLVAYRKIAGGKGEAAAADPGADRPNRRRNKRNK